MIEQPPVIKEFVLRNGSDSGRRAPAFPWPKGGRARIP